MSCCGRAWEGNEVTGIQAPGFKPHGTLALAFTSSIPTSEVLDVTSYLISRVIRYLSGLSGG